MNWRHQLGEWSDSRDCHHQPNSGRCAKRRLRRVLRALVGGVSIGLATAAFASSYLQVGYRPPIWLSLTRADAIQVLRLSILGMLVGIFGASFAGEKSATLFAFVGSMLGASLGVVVSQPFFPGNTYMGNQVHFVCITVPITCLLALLGGIAGWAYCRELRRRNKIS